jgi:hypothetical protein
MPFRLAPNGLRNATEGVPYSFLPNARRKKRRREKALSTSAIDESFSFALDDDHGT